MGRKAKTREAKRIVYSTTLSPEVAKQIDELRSILPNSVLLSTLIEDGLTLRRKGYRVIPIPEDLYEEIISLIRGEQTIEVLIELWIYSGIERTVKGLSGEAL